MIPTISAQRTCEAKQGLAMRRREQWGARRSYTDERTVNHPATRLFLHITVTNPGNYATNDAHARGIEAIGIARFPNTGISYNAGVMPNATIYEFQPLGRRGAHTVNDFQRSTCSTSGCPGRGTSLSAPSYNLNYNARAVVLCQNVTDPVTDAQVRSAAMVGAAWKRCGYVDRGARWHGHRCVSSKSCPGDRAFARLDEIAALTETYTSKGLPGAVAPAPTPEEDDMPSPSEWTAADKNVVRDTLLSALQFPTIVTAPNGEKWNVAHALSWLMGNTVLSQTLIREAIAEAADDPEVPVTLTPEERDALAVSFVTHLFAKFATPSEPVVDDPGGS